MTKNKIPAMAKQKKPFLPEIKYNPESNDFSNWTISVRPELTEEEID